MATSTATIGQRVGRAEGPAKVTGAAVYPADINLTGTLVGKCLRSPLPHARIVSIDASEACALPGVHAVLTGFECFGAGVDILRTMVNLSPVMTEMHSAYNSLVFLVFKS